MILESFRKEISAAIDEYPFDPYPYELAAQLLVNLKIFDEAYFYLQKLNELNPGHIQQSGLESLICLTTKLILQLVSF